MPAHSKIVRRSKIKPEVDWHKNVLNMLIGSRMERPEFKVFKCKDVDLEMIEILTGSRMSRFAVWPRHINDRREPTVHPDDAAQGAEYCNQYEDQLAKLELTVKDYWQYLAGRFNRMQGTDIVEAFETRCIADLDEYNHLLIQISIERASHQMKKPLVMKKNHVLYLEPADVTIIPWDTESIVDDTDTPMLLVKHNRIRFDDLYPMGNDVDGAVRLEMACTMHVKSMTRFQAVYMDGITAILRFVQTPDVDSIFRDAKTRLDYAHYTLPQDRNGFVCHLVNLLKNGDNYEKYFKCKREILKAVPSM